MARVDPPVSVITCLPCRNGDFRDRASRRTILSRNLSNLTELGERNASTLTNTYAKRLIGAWGTEYNMHTPKAERAWSSDWSPRRLRHEPPFIREPMGHPVLRSNSGSGRGPNQLPGAVQRFGGDDFGFAHRTGPSEQSMREVAIDEYGPHGAAGASLTTFSPQHPETLSCPESTRPNRKAKHSGMDTEGDEAGAVAGQ